MRSPCPHPLATLIRTPERERPERGEAVYWCPACVREFRVGPPGRLSEIREAIGRVWRLAKG